MDAIEAAAWLLFCCAVAVFTGVIGLALGCGGLL